MFILLQAVQVHPLLQSFIGEVLGRYWGMQIKLHKLQAEHTALTVVYLISAVPTPAFALTVPVWWSCRQDANSCDNHGPSAVPDTPRVPYLL